MITFVETLVASITTIVIKITLGRTWHTMATWTFELILWTDAMKLIFWIFACIKAHVIQSDHTVIVWIVACEEVNGVSWAQKKLKKFTFFHKKNLLMAASIIKRNWLEHEGNVVLWYFHTFGVVRRLATLLTKLSTSCDVKYMPSAPFSSIWYLLSSKRSAQLSFWTFS